jgi:hypothetical protein
MGKPAKRDPFVCVAQAIGDERLAGVLRELGRDINTDISNADFVVRRADLRADLKGLLHSAKEFERARKRLSGMRLLDLPLGADRLLLDAKRTVRDTIAFCDRALARISAKGGRPPKAGRTLCATIIIEAWTHTRGREPGDNSVALQEICDRYWIACGQTSLIGQSGEPANWRRVIASARKSRWRSSVRVSFGRARDGTK